jgi:hypothetical protein
VKLLDCKLLWAIFKSTITQVDITTLYSCLGIAQTYSPLSQLQTRVVGSGISFVAQQDIVVTAEETAQRQSFSPTTVGTRHSIR